MSNERSIWGSLTFAVSKSADAIGSIASTVATTAEAGEALASTAKVMAESNNRVIQIETTGKEMAKKAELSDLYPELDFT